MRPSGICTLLLLLLLSSFASSHHRNMVAGVPTTAAPLDRGLLATRSSSSFETSMLSTRAEQQYLGWEKQRMMEFLVERLRLTKESIELAKLSNGATAVAGVGGDNDQREIELQQATTTAQPICSEAAYNTIVRRMSFCTDPFFHWTGQDFFDSKSVHFACNGACADSINSLTSFEINCLEARNPTLRVIFSIMCTKEENQFCGEPFAVLKIFLDCPSIPAAYCPQFAGCSWNATTALCRPNYNQELMAKMCTPCLKVLYKAFGEAAGESQTSQVTTEKALDTICISTAGTYCIETISSDNDLSLSQRWFIDFTNPLVNKVCTTSKLNCFLRFHSLNVNWFESASLNTYQICRNANSSDTGCAPTYQTNMAIVERTRALLDNFCTNKENQSATDTSTYCLSLPNEARTSQYNFNDCWNQVFERGENCSSTCLSVLTQTAQSWSCCAGSLQVILRNPLAAPLPDSTSAQNYTRESQSSPGTGGIVNLQSQCQFDLSGIDLGEDRCAASFSTFSSPLNLTLGIAWGKIEDQESVLALLKNYLVQDLAGRFGVPVEGFTSLELKEDPDRTIDLATFGGSTQFGATRFNFRLQAQSDFATQSAVQEFQSLKDKGLLPLPLTRSYIITACTSLGGCTDPTSLSLVLQGQSSTSSGVAGHCWEMALATRLLPFATLLLALL